MVVNYTTDELIEMERQYVAPTYKRPPFVLEHGDGVCLFDTEGRRYLDFVAGIAVNAFGAADPEIAAVIGEQAAVLGHVSNLYYSVPMLELARDLVESSFADKVFFCNSGAEANEAAFKFARRWALDRHGEGKSRIVAFTNAFHGRTMGALAATPREKYQAPFR
ncbi:MAG: aminotransferase class III-fold pyridoxal phosphate-dependent enzyme, partial [Anaerolineae bacterium]